MDFNLKRVELRTWAADKIGIDKLMANVIADLCLEDTDICIMIDQERDKEFLYYENSNGVIKLVPLEHEGTISNGETEGC